MARATRRSTIAAGASANEVASRKRCATPLDANGSSAIDVMLAPVAANRCFLLPTILNPDRERPT
jgi:hypothetical protein